MWQKTFGTVLPCKYLKKIKVIFYAFPVTLEVHLKAKIKSHFLFHISFFTVNPRYLRSSYNGFLIHCLKGRIILLVSSHTWPGENY
jgi:hypothetical protein